MIAGFSAANCLAGYIHSAHSLHELIASIVCMPPTNAIAIYGAILRLATPPNFRIFYSLGHSYSPTLEPFLLRRLVNVLYAWESYLRMQRGVSLHVVVSRSQTFSSFTLGREEKGLVNIV